MTKNNFQIYFVFIFFLQSTNMWSQDQTHQFVGTIQLEDKSLISYKLVFDEFEDGTITGKTITDFSGAHRTESTINGTLDRKNNKISFIEEANIATKSDYPDSTFCYVHLYNAKIKLKKRKSIIQGHFFGRYDDGTKCLEGDIYLINEKQFFKKADKMTKRARFFVGKDKVSKAKEIIENTREGVGDMVLEEDDQLIVHTPEDTVLLKVWDDEHVDGDRISINSKERFYAQNMPVKKEPIFISVPIESDSLNLSFFAVNEGKIPPNSARLAIISGTQETPIKIKLNKDKKVNLLFIKSE